jgi:hypothetical protein
MQGLGVSACLSARVPLLLLLKLLHVPASAARPHQQVQPSQQQQEDECASKVKVVQAAGLHLVQQDGLGLLQDGGDVYAQLCRRKLLQKVLNFKLVEGWCEM